MRIPVTLKIRSGPDQAHETAIEVARHAAESGARAIDVHARNVAQAYVGGPDWGVVARVKQAVRIPVMGSGGIRQAADVLLFLKETQADGAAVARGCLGNPWIFAQAKALVQGNAPPVPPTRGERGRVLLQLIEGEFRHYGPPLALRRLPRTSCYFAKILPNFADFRAAVRGIRELAAFRRLVKEFFR